MKLSFIGMGNMAYAILKGGCTAGFFDTNAVFAFDINQKRLTEVAAETGIHPAAAPPRQPSRPTLSCWL